MPTALEQYKAKSTALSRIREHRATVTKAMHVAEMGGGAFAAGVLDTKLGPVMGAPPSLLVGVATTAAGVALAQPHLAAVGVGMVLPHLYGVGQNIAAG